MLQRTTGNTSGICAFKSFLYVQMTAKVLQTRAPPKDRYPPYWLDQVCFWRHRAPLIVERVPSSVFFLHFLIQMTVACYEENFFLGGVMEAFSKV